MRRGGACLGLLVVAGCAGAEDSTAPAPVGPPPACVPGRVIGEWQPGAAFAEADGGLLVVGAPDIGDGGLRRLPDDGPWEDLEYPPPPFFPHSMARSDDYLYVADAQRVARVRRAGRGGDPDGRPGAWSQLPTQNVTGPVRGLGVAATDTGDQVFVGGTSGPVAVWDGTAWATLADAAGEFSPSNIVALTVCCGGVVYAATAPGTIVRLEPFGHFEIVTDALSEGTTPGIVALAFSDDTIYAVRHFEVSSLTAGGLWEKHVLPGDEGTRSIAATADGLYRVSDQSALQHWNGTELVEVSPVWGPGGLSPAPGRRALPSVAARDGVLHILEHSTGRVWRQGENGLELALNPESALVPQRPRALAFHHGTAFVAGDEIVRYDTEWNGWTEIGSFPDGFYDLAVDEDGLFAVSDGYLLRRGLTPDWTKLAGPSGDLAPAGGMRRIAVDEADVIVATVDTPLRRVTSDGSIRDVRDVVLESLTTRDPQGVEIVDGTLYVADFDAVHRLKPNDGWEKVDHPIGRLRRIDNALYVSLETVDRLCP